tara:strand:- start:1 stop:309 length:309 start_codon:yes stop_codon:yes gene_type:complete
MNIYQYSEKEQIMTKQEIIERLIVRCDKDIRERDVFIVASKTHFIYENVFWKSGKRYHEFNIDTFDNPNKFPKIKFKPKQFKRFREASDLLRSFIDQYQVSQ